MPSDSIAGFLDRAQANRVLFPEQVEQLIRQPDIPQSDLTSLCEYLLSRGVLTRFQATAIREGRGTELNFSGYPIIDDLGPCPGGTAYKALHPSLRTPLILRRIQSEWLAPADTATDYVNRARTIGMLTHPNLVPLFDAGLHEEQAYLVLDQPLDVIDLETLASEVGGAMPGFLAAEYGRAVASVLRLAHERGGVHGEVRPGNLLVGPITQKTGSVGKPRRRPSPTAVVRLAELGLIPFRPAANAFPPDRLAAPYLPPERIDAGTPTPLGDVYGLGATLYFLLAGRSPFGGDDLNDLLNRVRSVEPAPLAVLRPDLPADLVEFVTQMMAKQPDRRPVTASDVEKGLIKFCRPGTVPPQVVSAVVPMAAPVSSAGPVAYPVAIATPPEEPVAEPVDAWGVGADTFTSAHADAEPAPRKRAMSDQEKSRSKMLLILGLMLHVTAVSLLIAWAVGAFSSSPDPDPTPEKKEKPNPPKKGKKGNAQNLRGAVGGGGLEVGG